VGPFSLEAAKVVPPQEPLTGSIHGGAVQRYWDVPTVAELERTGDPPVVNHGPIPLRSGIQGGMEGLWHLPGIQHPDVPRQQRIQRPDESLGRMARGGQDMDDLAQRMHPRVGASAGSRARTHAGQLLQGVLEDLLNGPQPGLALPTVEGRTVVAE